MSKYSDLIQETYKDDIAEATTSKYSDIIQEEYGDNQTSAMRASVFSSAPINPDVAAQQYQISKQVNLPVNIVRAKENEIKQMTELNSIDYDAIAKNFPAVATQLSDPNKVGAIRDDVDKLSYFERVVANTGQEFRNQEAGAQTTDLRLKKIASSVAGKNNLSPQEENELALYYQNLEGTDYKLGLIGKIPQYTIGQIPTIVDVAKTAIPAAGGSALIGGAPAVAVATGLSMFTRSAKRMTVDAFDEYSKFVDEKGEPIETSVAAGAAVLTGGVGGSLELFSGKVLLSPFKKIFTRESAKKLMQTSAGREALKNIAKGAFAEGTTEVAEEYVGIGLGEAAKVLSDKEFTPFYTPIPEEAKLEALNFKGTENLTKQEQEQYRALQNRIFEAKKSPLNLEKVAKFFASEEVSKRTKESLVAGLIGGGGFSTAGAGITYAANLYDKREQSRAEKEQIKETTQNVKESKTFNRSQELFKDVTEETLGQQNVYIPAEKVQTYFQNKTPQEVEEFYNQVPEAREQMQDALESGGNLILKGNNAYAAFAQDAYAPLQDFASLSPENINDEAYQDAFLQDVVSNVNYDEKVKKVRTEQDLVNKNIETQIQNLGIPYRDAKDLTTLTKAFYETNLKKYGNEQATKLLNNYFKNLQIKNEVYVDDVAEMLKKARAPQKLPKAGKPLLKFLKEKGGVKLGSNLAGELNVLGITPKTAKGLFKKDGGVGDVDNIPASEFADRFPNINTKAEGDYVNRQALLDLIAEEAKGADISRQISEEQRLVEDFIQQLDQLGLDLNAPDEEIKKAIDEYRKGGYNQDQTKTPAFKKWFGNSKVVDENGEPLVVYHGTDKIFKKFDKKKTVGGQFWFTNKKDLIEKGEVGAAGKGKIVDAYLSIKNPAGWDEYDKFTLDELINRGYDGIILEEENQNTYVAFEPTQIKSVENKGTFDPKNANIYLQKSTTAPRGQFKYLQGKPIISLFQDKNKSTLLHELGHTFLEIQKELSQIPEISEEATKDWKVLEEWLDIKDGNITVEAHEKFARGFEAYLREGKAPSIELRNAFARFFTWLTRIYKDVLQLNVKLNNEVREVFDRMLATQEAIDAQKNNPLFRVDDQVLELLNAKEKEDYLKISENAGLKARETLTKKALRQKEKENTKFYKQQRSAVKKEIRQAMEESPTYRALNFFKTGELYGAEEQVEPYKLNEEEAQFNYPEFYKKLKNKGIFEKDGVSLDIAAEDFGFKDGGVMLNSLSSAKPFNNELRRATDEEMIRRFGDMLYDGTIEDEAKDAMQNEARANKILYELNGINRKVKSYVENKEAYKQRAQEIFAKKPLSVATDSNQFYIAEVKAAREAGKALGKKDFEKAITEKKKQLLNHYLYRESLQLKKELQTAYKKYAKYKKRPAQGKVVLEEEYREKIVELLANFGLAKMPEGVEFSVADLEAWKKEQTDLGILGLVEFPEVEEFANKPFKQLTADEFRTLNDDIENIAHTARGIRTLEVNGVKQQLETIANEIVETADKNLKDKPTTRGELTTLERLKETFDWVASSLIKTKNTALKIDGEKPLGTFYNLFVKDVAAAELKKNEMMDEAYKKLDEIYNKHFGGYKIPTKKTYFEDVNYSYDKQSVLAFALNWGNEINRKRIRDGFGYSDAQVQSIISSLTPNEWAFVQDMWDLINSYWSSVEALEKKLFGIAPRKQKALSFKITLDSGETIDLKGGYYPLSYTDKSNFLSDVAADIKEMMFGATVDKINFHKSFTKERTEQKVSKEVDLTLRPAFQHISQVVNDIAMKEYVWNSYKIINNRKVKSTLANKLGLPEFKQLQSWLYDMYGRVMVQEGFLTDLAKKLRSISTTFRMGFKAATVLIQITGFLQSIPKVGYKNMGIGLWKALGNGNPAAINKAAKLAFAKSKILKDRSTTFNRDIYEVMNRLRNKGEIKAKIAKFAFLGITKMQMLVDVPTWYAAYYKGLKDFKGDDAKAVEFADLTLEKTQGSSHKQALSAIERNEGAMARAFTTFYTYFNVKLNLLSESYRGTDFKKPSDVAKFASDFLLLFFLDAVMTEFLREGIFSGKDSDDDEDKALHYLNMTAGSLAATVPGISQLYSKATGFNATPAGLQGLDIVGGGIGKLGKETIKAFDEEEEVDLFKVMQGLNETGAVFGYGGGSQIDIFIKALKEQENGEDVAPINYILKMSK